MSSFIRERIYYEIAMAVGNSQELDVMLKEALSTCLRKLNCLAGAVLQRVEDNRSRVSYELVYAIPKRLKRNNAMTEGLESLPAKIDGADEATFLSGLPDIQSSNGFNRYVLELPGFGLLLLIKSEPGLTRPELNSLAQINRKLAGACRSCVANERLQREIVERKRAEEKYRSIFNNAVEGIFQTTMDGRVLEMNPAMATILGYASSEDAKKNISNLAQQIYVSADRRDRFLNKLERRGHVSGFELEFFRRDGSIGWLVVSARLVCGMDAKSTRIEGSADDITTKKMGIFALREARMKAERLSDMKSSFLSTVSHELRTPLTAIIGFAKLIGKRMEDLEAFKDQLPSQVTRKHEVVRKNTEIITVEGERLAELINNVLDLAKIEEGWFEWSDEEVSLNEVIGHSLNSTGVLFEDSPVSLVSDVSPDLPPVSGDHDRLVQVVINLLSNAAKFTVEGSVTVSAETRDGELLVKVSDTGPGVPENQAKTIFDKYRQLTSSADTKTIGTGLGLSICLEIVEHHGGRIWVEPNPVGGSVFAFTLPLA